MRWGHALDCGCPRPDRRLMLPSAEEFPGVALGLATLELAAVVISSMRVAAYQLAA
jgi:hypothetical protein